MKTEFKHTKGEWRWYFNGKYHEVRGTVKMSPSIAIFDIPRKMHTDFLEENICEKEESEANAKLIASAPELLMACIWAEEQFQILADRGLYPEHLLAEFGGDGIMPIIKAIRKATE